MGPAQTQGQVCNFSSRFVVNPQTVESQDPNMSKLIWALLTPRYLVCALPINNTAILPAEQNTAVSSIDHLKLVFTSGLWLLHNAHSCRRPAWLPRVQEPGKCNHQGRLTPLLAKKLFIRYLSQPRTRILLFGAESTSDLAWFFMDLGPSIEEIHGPR